MADSVCPVLPLERQTRFPRRSMGTSGKKLVIDSVEKLQVLGILHLPVDTFRLPGNQEHCESNLLPKAATTLRLK